MNRHAAERGSSIVKQPSHARWRRALACAATLVIAFGAGCTGGSVYERNAEARHLAATLQTQFTQGVDASGRAVMAHTDQESARFAREAEQARQEVGRIDGALARLLGELEYAEELKLLEEFRGKFAAYEVLDRDILELAVENTNLKGMRLSFGPANEAADAFKESVNRLAQAASGAEAARVRMLALEALVAVREIQVLEAPHIAEANDARMTSLETTMASAETSARTALTELARVVDPAQLAPASAALDRFAKAHAEVVALSRRNTNVRSLDMTLGQKRTIVATCGESLHALIRSLGKRVSRATR